MSASAVESPAPMQPPKIIVPKTDVSRSEVRFGEVSSGGKVQRSAGDRRERSNPSSTTQSRSNSGAARKTGSVALSSTPKPGTAASRAVDAHKAMKKGHRHHTDAFVDAAEAAMKDAEAASDAFDVAGEAAKGAEEALKVAKETAQDAAEALKAAKETAQTAAEALKAAKETAQTAEKALATLVDLIGQRSGGAKCSVPHRASMRIHSGAGQGETPQPQDGG